MRRFILTILLLLGAASACVQAQVNKRYFVWVGRDMVMENRYREAIETLNILLRADPEAYEGYFWRGIAKYNLDDLLGAERDFTITLAKNPVYTMAYQFRALTRSRMGNYDDAMKDFQEAIDLRPDYPAPYYSRGVANLLTKKYAEAVEDFDMYLRFNPRDADGYANRGMAYLNLRDTTAAYDDFERAIRTNREYPRGYLERGALYMTQQRYDEALEDFDRAVACDSTYTAAYFNRALARYQKHRLSEALADFDKVLELDPTSSVTYFNRALLRTEIGDYNRALEDYDNVALFSPDNVMVYYNRAGLYARLGDFRAAKADYDRAIERYPDFANAYLGRASVRFMLRDTEGAERDRRIAEQKIAEYRARLKESDGELSYADTTRRFDRLLSFDTNLSEASLRNAVAGNEQIALRPLCKFTLRAAQDGVPLGFQSVYDTYGLEEMLASLDNDAVAFTCAETDLSADELVRQHAAGEPSGTPEATDWRGYFLNSITQLLLKQYTNALTAASAAIALEPQNPYLYINRSAIQAEMTDFIASMDSEYSHLSLESDRAARMREASRTYSYDEAIADLNKAAKLAPELPQIYYNRGNLLALSGRFPEAFADYSQAIRLDPLFAEAYFNRGLVQIYMKDTRKGLLDVSKSGELGISEAYAVLKLYGSGPQPADDGATEQDS